MLFSIGFYAGKVDIYIFFLIVICVSGLKLLKQAGVDVFSRYKKVYNKSKLIKTFLNTKALIKLSTTSKYIVKTL